MKALPKTVKEGDEFIVKGREARRLGVRPGTRLAVKLIKDNGLVMFQHPGYEKTIESINAEDLEPVDEVREEGYVHAAEMTKREAFAMEIMGNLLDPAEIKAIKKPKDQAALILDRAELAFAAADALLSVSISSPSEK